MVKRQFKNNLDEAIHSAASGLYRAKVIDEKTMREYDTPLIQAAPNLNPKKVTLVGNAGHSSQGDLDR